MTPHIRYTLDDCSIYIRLKFGEPCKASMVARVVGWL